MPHVRNRGNGLVNVGVDLAYLQAQAGHSVTVAAESGEYRPLLESAGVTFFEFPHAKSAGSMLKSPFRFRRLLCEARPDIVHAHVVTGILLATFLRFRTSYKLVASLHSEFRRSAILMGLADRIISVSDASAGQLAKRGIGRDKISVVTNAPLDTPRLRDAGLASPATPILRPSIATLAGLTYRKGIDVLLDAFERVHQSVPFAHLYIIGQGPDRDAFVTHAQRLAARDYIHFLGFQPDPKPYLAVTDVFVLASRREPFGLAIVEARAAGCAIVASDVDGIPEATDGGRAAMLVPAGDRAQLADALTALLTDDSLLAEWKRKATENLAQFSVERLHRETLEAYARAQHPHPNPRR